MGVLYRFLLIGVAIRPIEYFASLLDGMAQCALFGLGLVTTEVNEFMMLFCKKNIRNNSDMIIAPLYLIRNNNFDKL